MEEEKPEEKIKKSDRVSTHCLIEIQIAQKDRRQKRSFGDFVVCLNKMVFLFTVFVSVEIWH